MLKRLIRGKYYYHLFQHHYNELLQQDCLCEALRIELKKKASYHNNKVVEISLKM
jgi:hypothetical protein